MVKLTVSFALILFTSVSQAFQPSGKASYFGKTLQPSFNAFQLRKNSLQQAIETKVNTVNTRFSNYQINQSHKSKGRAFLQSLIIPGWGQHYAQSKTMFKVFLTSEVVLWSSFVGFTVWSNWLENDFKTFAANHAGIDPQGKPARYFVDIGNFDNLFDYNQAQLRDRDVNDLYPENSEFFWQWDSEANRVKYEDLRIRSDRAKNRAEFTLAAIFANHLISAIHATWAVHKFNKKLAQKGFGFNLNMENTPGNFFIRVNLSKKF